MRRFVPWLGAVALVLVGYTLGSLQVFSPDALFAQGNAPVNPKLSDETQAKIRAAADALKAAGDALTNDQKYSPATKGVNTFAILSGGRNVIEDLDNGAIVDPETYAALYADLAVDTVAVHLGRDDKNRLTYKGKVIQIYPVGFMMQRYRQRMELTGEDLTASIANPTRQKPAKNADDE